MMSREAVFSYKTRDSAQPGGKPRVYFTCHPDDFDRYFEKICEDLFKTHDCAIYYTEDMTAELFGFAAERHNTAALLCDDVSKNVLSIG